MEGSRTEANPSLWPAADRNCGAGSGLDGMGAEAAGPRRFDFY